VGDFADRLRRTEEFSRSAHPVLLLIVVFPMRVFVGQSVEVEAASIF